MSPKPTNIEPRAGLGRYWLSLLACTLVLAGYIALIELLHTETATRSTAPPWYSWTRFPPTQTRLQSIYLVLPAIAFAGWVYMVRRNFLGKAVALWGFLFVLLMNITIAMMDGSPAAISKPFNWPGSEFFSDVPAVKSIGPFLNTYVHELYHYSIHTRTHPPGAVLFLYFVKCLFGPSIEAAAWAAVIVTATGIIPFYLLSRRVAGQSIARLAVAIYPVAPSLVIFGATSMDGVILVSILWSIYFLERIISDGGWFTAILAGLSLSISLMFSYVTVCAGAMMMLYAILELSVNPRRLAHVAGYFIMTAISIVTPLYLLYAFTSFNYLACLHGSRYYDHYSMRTFTMSFGRYLDISFCNLFAFLIGVGLPAVVLWGRETLASLKPQSSADRFNLALVASILFFSFAKLFTHETERVWLFFVPLALIPAASWIARQNDEKGRLLEWTLCLSLAQTWLFQLLLKTLW